MDRAAAVEPLSAFVGATVLTGNPLAFVNLVIEKLTQRGAVPVRRMYAAPFTEKLGRSPDGGGCRAQAGQTRATHTTAPPRFVGIKSLLSKLPAQYQPAHRC